MKIRLEVTRLGLRRLARVVARMVKTKSLVAGAKTALARAGEGAHEEGPSIFAPEVMLPLQYYEAFRRKHLLEGEKALMFAVLEDAVEGYRRYLKSSTKKRPKPISRSRRMDRSPGQALALLIRQRLRSPRYRPGIHAPWPSPVEAKTIGQHRTSQYTLSRIAPGPFEMERLAPRSDSECSIEDLQAVHSRYRTVATFIRKLRCTLARKTHKPDLKSRT